MPDTVGAGESKTTHTSKCSQKRVKGTSLQGSWKEEQGLQIRKYKSCDFKGEGDVFLPGSSGGEMNKSGRVLLESLSGDQTQWQL